MTLPHWRRFSPRALVLVQEMDIYSRWGRGLKDVCHTRVHITWKEFVMSEEKKKELVRFILSRLLEVATNGGLQLMWIDLETGRALFKVNPNQEQVEELLRAVPQAGGA